MFLKRKRKEQTPPQIFSTDIDIYKWVGDTTTYDENKIAEIDMEKIDLAYNNGTGLMQEIDSGMKVINTRATLLLSYISALVAIIAGFLFTESYINESLKIYALFALTGFILIIFTIASKILDPNLAATIHSEPKNILNRNMFKYDMKAIKIIETELLQDRIHYNSVRQGKKAKYLKICVFATLAILASAPLAFLFFLFMD